MKPAAASLSASRLLVVDDDPHIRDAFARRLTQRGYQVEVAADGRQALQRAASEHFDLVLLDQMMPGMSGVDVLRLLRATLSQSELPVIMLTGIGESQLLVESLTQGANDYVVKPADLLAITARIQAQIERSRSEQLARGTDALTGLYNRARFLEAVHSRLGEAQSISTKRRGADATRCDSLKKTTGRKGISLPEKS